MMLRQQRAAGSRRGYTLVELLVSISIIGLLVAIMLPAVMRARESAHRTQCVSNLKQLGVALHNYHETFGSLPFGALAHRGIGPSWQVGLLPYLDQAPLFNAFNMVGVSTGSPTAPGSANSALLNRKSIPVVWCPSSWIMRFTTVGAVSVQMSSYVGISGAASDSTFTPSRRSACCVANANDGEMSADGMLVANSIVRLGDAKDGTSNVLAIGEISDFAYLSDGTPKRVDGSHSAGWCAGTTAVGTPPSLMAVGMGTMPQPAYNLTTIAYPPNFRYAPYGSTTPYRGIHETRGPNNPLTSPHTGGAQGLKADGAVVFISENIDIETLKKLACRDDGTPISAN